MFFACNGPIEQLDSSLTKDEKGHRTAFGEVVVACTQIMMLAMDYYSSWPQTVANWSQSVVQDGGRVLKTMSLAYELYWHLNGNLVLRHAMTKVIDEGFHSSSILRNAATLSHPNINPIAHQQAFAVLSEILSMHYDYDGELPGKNQLALKPELLAVKNPHGQWVLPTRTATMVLANRGGLQVIRGGAITIILDYTQGQIDFTEGPSVVGGILVIEYRNRRIATYEHQFDIDLDRNNGYRAVADYWEERRRRCLPEVVRGKSAGAKAILQHQVQLDELLLAACDNILQAMLLGDPVVNETLYQALYFAELCEHGFDDGVFARLNPRYLDDCICSAAVWKNYRCLKFLPKRLSADLKIGLKALDGATEDNLDGVWGALFVYTEIPMDELAKAYATGPFGLPGSSKRMPRRIKTPAFLSALVSEFPEVLDDVENSPVFSCQEEVDEFLDRERVGLKQVFHDIINVGDKMPSDAYSLALKVLEFADKPVGLPLFGDEMTVSAF